ncbi:MAG: hypothetical protein P4L42_12310 [Desulfocapsaceae bacterium]|nr:hypothetical protein [Desulfocapsaceae bacterium]
MKRNFQRQRFLVGISRGSVKYRSLRVLAGFSMVALSFGAAQPVQAANECGPLVSGFVTCAGGPYLSGISYLAPAGQAVNVTLNSNVTVTTNNENIGNAVNVSGINSGVSSSPVVLNANGATITNTGFPNSSLVHQQGLVASAYGDATVSASGKIDVAGQIDTYGILASAINGGNPNASASVTYTGPGITISGSQSAGIFAVADALKGNASIDALGNITGTVSAGGSSLAGLVCKFEHR